MNWDYLAGFFDGDGSINFLLQRNRNVLDFSLDIYQEDASVLRSLRAFLESEGIMGAEIRMSHRAYEIRWRNKKSILRIATNLVDRTVVKRQQLQAIIDYLESRITGDDFVRVMNEKWFRGGERVLSVSFRLSR